MGFNSGLKVLIASGKLTGLAGVFSLFVVSLSDWA
jgi:hypothetical protein